MKKRIIKIGVLVVVFIAALIGFGSLINRGSADMTADMEAATLPMISFIVEGKEANRLVGHKTEMDMTSMRETIAVCDDNESLTVKISYNDSGYDTLKYEVLTLDGNEQLYENTIKKVKTKATLTFKDALKIDEEALLRLTLTKDDSPLFYYTRIVKDNEYHLDECLKYIEELHTNMLKKENEDAVKKVMEPSSEGDNSTLQHVTIHSDLRHSMWGDLRPEMVGKLQFEIEEVKEAYIAVQLKYQVKCAGDNNAEEIYNVKEFFKVVYGTQRIYLLEYDRTMDEVFDTSNVVLGSKGVILGIANENLQYKVNEEGTIVAFVKENQLWNYNKTEDVFSLVFSFWDSENSDARNCTDKHSIQLLSMENDGSMTFSVCGYMNRGAHEGESGIVVYYYDGSDNVVEEKVFIPSTGSSLVIEEELNELAFYNEEQDVLYVMVNGTLLKIALEENEQTVLIEGLQDEQYVTSDDGNLLAYQKTKDGKISTEIWNFAKDSKTEVSVNSDEQVVPLGFIASDFVYGVSRLGDTGYDAVGNAIQGLSRLEIRNEENEIVKTYQKEGIYILGVTIGSNQIVLKQGTKDGNVYKEIAEDYITNNQTAVNEFVEVDSYRTDLKQTQYRLVFSSGIKNKKARTLKAKHVLQESPTVLEFEDVSDRKYFYVHGHGEQAGVFEEAGDAIKLADAISGVVISSKQSYVWEDGNREAYYHNFDMNRFTPKEGETTFTACVRAVLDYEGNKVDVVKELGTTSVQEILEKYLETEILQFRGCSSKAMFYLIDKGVPVIALKDSSSAILLIGYDAQKVTYVEPSSGSIFTSTIEKVDGMLEGSGKTFIAYVR